MRPYRRREREREKDPSCLSISNSCKQSLTFTIKIGGFLLENRSNYTSTRKKHFKRGVLPKCKSMHMKQIDAKLNRRRRKDILSMILISIDKVVLCLHRGQVGVLNRSLAFCKTSKPAKQIYLCWWQSLSRDRRDDVETKGKGHFGGKSARQGELMMDVLC